MHARCQLAYTGRMHEAIPEESRADSELIDRLGGTVAVARLCEVSSQAVTQWRRSGIPRARRMYLEVIRPEVALPMSDRRIAAGAR